MTPRTRRQSSPSTPAATGVARRHRPDYQIILFMGILVLLGLIVLYAISPARVELINQNGGSSLDQAHFMQKQLLYLGIGLAGFGFAATMTPEWWKRYTSKILLAGFAACFVLLILGLIPGNPLVINTGGATRWFNVGVGSFQPAELLKFGLLLYVAAFLGRRMQQGKVNSVNDTLVPVGIMVGLASLFIIVFQKDMGTGLTMVGMVLAMLVIAGLKARLFALVAGVGVGAGLLLIVTSPHRIARVLTFLNPSGTDVESYHITQATIAMGSGGLFGRGLGQGVSPFGYLPEAVNDSIFAVLGETFGFVGLIVILLLFFMLLRRLLFIVDRIDDPTMRLIVAGVFGLIMTHVVVNVGAMTGVFPLTGVTLPFLSFGGTSLLFMMLGLGLVFHISRYTSHRTIDDVKETGDEGSVRRRRVGRTRNAGTRRHQRA